MQPDSKRIGPKGCVRRWPMAVRRQTKDSAAKPRSTRVCRGRFRAPVGPMPLDGAGVERRCRGRSVGSDETP